jgi:formylglycine-generating enzyme required for sulfatase activity
MILISSMILVFTTSIPADDAEQMVVVPAGSFIMGDGAAWCGSQEREVTLTRSFYLGQHEVTNQEYLEALQWAFDNGYVVATPNIVRDNLDGWHLALLYLSYDACEIQFDGALFSLREAPAAQSAYPHGYDPSDHPVKTVSWYGSVRYCDWLSLQAGLPRAYEHSGDWSCNGGDPYGAEGYRLPTDAEWEYAAVFSDERIFPWGGEAPVCSLANFNRHPTGQCVGWTAPVGSLPDGNSHLGLSDMAGSVWEFCNDWWVCDLGTDPVTDPTGPNSGTYRVMHGGDWGWADQYHLLCAGRPRDESGGPHSGWNNAGFRVAKTVDTSGIDSETARDRSQLLFDVTQPNPFTQATRITYTIPGSAQTLLTVYDAAGRRIRTLVNAAQHAGTHSVSWDGTDEAGSPVAAGVYFCNLSVGTQTATRQVRLVR